MAVLEWDKTGQRDIESGISKVVLFVAKQNPTANENPYEAGVAWNGITGISENPGGADLTDLYADNIKYASLRAAEKFSCTIEAFTYPDEWNECDGSTEAETGVFLGQQTRRAFALCYRTEVGDDQHPGMDKGYKVHFVYNLTASPSGRSYATINENPDAISFSWDASSTPVNVSGTNYKAVSTITIDSTKLDTNGKTKLGTLMDIVYGTENTASAMPTPAEVLSNMH